MFISRLTLSTSPSARALAGFWQSPNAGQRKSAQHNLLWSVFADTKDRERDFIWREESEGAFTVLSHRPPQQNDLFEPHKIKPFSPKLQAGSSIMFKLRANATRSRDNGRIRADVVMDALYAIPKEDRALCRMDIAQAEGEAWLKRQGEGHGFEVLGCSVDAYTAETVQRFSVRAKNAPKFGILDLSGGLKITDPEKFIQKVSFGFGRAKSFGCGLMLIRK
ncbi:CRISPR-associated protein Cse3 [Acetobacter malorum DSM 14337]|uniref:CRISPR-associated protein Cse3 n=1 Tax=Acetobacter malorum DSM 14337 TaxID=1307910 RepID=A0ABQ0Q037_9PROT|nr:type I-E CRISPR-associated protein Cas6/Cse3/CasE [Acetobacter malorum]KXV05744.1 hypothetical protein AD930_11505 [Acetobacter malorum]GBQ85809.1 CRISPR-associated protein Cse3 [Acetobacter malorum DSM 14337]